jgi:GntR family transcriptional regulator/MocR family aminotransferase
VVGVSRSRRTVTPLVIALDRRSGQPLALQIAGQVRALLQAGTLSPGDRLPSSRRLAAEVGVARGVVEQAFDQLIAEGWAESRRGAGTFVADALLRPPVPDTPTSLAARRRVPVVPSPLIRLDSGAPWIDPKHHEGWRRAWRSVAASAVPRGYPDAAGLPALRHAIAAHVSVHRGVACSPEQVMVTSGTTHALALLLGSSEPAAVAIEDPGYRAAVSTARDLGWDVVDIPLDAGGLDVPALRAERRGDIAAVYVTPAHQHPLGMVMSAARRTALLAEARRRGALVIEDDYDSEFRYDVAPLPALAQLGLDQVAYLGTASKVIAPGLRIGWLVADEDRVADIAERRARRHDHPSWPVQRALQVMFDDGHVLRLVRSARRVYADRSRIVRARLAPYGEIAHDVAGMYLTLELDADRVVRVVDDALRAGVELSSVADYCRSARRSGLVIGFGGVSDEDLARALDVIEKSLAAPADVANHDTSNGGVLA